MTGWSIDRSDALARFAVRERRLAVWIALWAAVVAAELAAPGR